MKKHTLAVALLVFSQCASAAWTKALVLEDRTFFIDRESIVKVQNGYRLWSMSNLKRPQKIDDMTFQSIKVYEEYNCVDSTYRTIHSVFYKGQNGTGPSETINVDDGVAEPAIPGQVSGGFLRALCK